MRKTKENAGITLIALVITIIVLLILAGISIITLTGQNGILTQANKAKQESELAEEKEKAGLVSQELKIEKAQGKDVDKTGFQKMVDSQFGSSKATGDVEDSTYVIVVVKTGNIYLINEDGTIDKAGNKNNMKKDENPGVLEDLGNNTYAVNSIEDLVALSYTVDSGTDTYEGKTVTLGRSLYFNGMFDSYANPNSKYEVKSDEETSKNIGYISNESATTTIKELVTTGEGFIPIGVGGDTNSFKGNLDGKNNYLANVYIKKENGGTGLFGATSGKEGNVKISNLGIKSGTIEGENSGGIIGLNWGNLTIENCYNKANVYGDYITASGIVAASITDDSYKVLIENCYNSGEVTGADSAGGIIGNASSNAEIKNCYNLGEIKGVRVGGIIGMNGDIVSNCYNIGTVINSRNGETGGIAGEYAKRIENCYNKGKILGGSRMAGILSYTGDEVEIINCYNEGELELKDSTRMVGGILGNGVKTQTNIENCYNTASISGNSFEFVGGIAGSMSGDITGCYNTGSISGNNLRISGGIAAFAGNITDCYNTGNIQGKSGIAGGILGQGQNVKNCYNTGDINPTTLGAAGIAYAGKAEDCYNTGNVTGGTYTAGITAGGSVTNCYNTGNVTGGDYQTAGITTGGDVVNCYNTGSVNSKGKGPTAGITASGKAINCYNTGNVKSPGNYSTAGITASGDADNCYNFGDISSESSSAGITAGGNVNNCFNSGKIEGGQGPSSGITSSGSAINCYNVGTIKVKGNVPVAGCTTSGSATNCYNTGNVTGENAPTSGVVGYSGTATNCYNTGNIEGTASQLLYEINMSTVKDCAYLLKTTNAQANGAVGKTEAEMNEIMDLQKFVDLMNQKVEENNSNASNTKWKKWKLANGVPVFAE